MSKTQPESLGRQLNIIFNYNGHSFDAYEVLGVPAGCSLDVVERAFHRLTVETDAKECELFARAYRAIQSRR